MTRRLVIVVAFAAGLLAVPGAQSASAGWVVKGHGSGHGVGMSQYGAYGLAQNGRSYEQIVGHYFTDTRIGRTPARKVKVLLDSGSGVRFTHGTRACGRELRRGQDYKLTREGSAVVLRRANGNRLSACGDSGLVRGAGGRVRIGGEGVYRGDLVADEQDGTLLVINKARVDDYVAGVVANEMSPSWDQQALRAQAVVARSYAVATARPGPFDHYEDARSQVYGGLASETAATNRAVRRTKEQVVMHRGQAATTYFFSTSGGQTESVQSGFPGASSSPYLKAVNDPFDEISPSHDWTQRLSDAEMESKLSGLYSGRLKRIEIKQKGDSPRIVVARVVGSRGSGNVSGPGLRERLGLLSAWARFRHR
ncbi:MAG: SpoIID/LytB domain-containing protein [Solirubrobacterales bacterium]|nr:SpoIID/LytB domain-containing protein [Solirubrobacterales bacterium]